MKKRMTKAEQRVLIAKDVIAQLKARRTIGGHGDYITWKNPVPIKEGAQVKDLFKDIPQCKVCAKGAALLAAVDRFNKLKITVWEADDQAKGYYKGSFLEKWFSLEQLGEIESAFEGWSKVENYTEFSYKHLPKQAANAGIRISMIMQNIIRNEGTFVPEQFIHRMMTKGYYARI